MQPIADLSALLSQMQPVLAPGRYAFVTVPDGHAVDPLAVIASVREAEGLSVVMAEADAAASGLAVAFLADWITLTVHSDLAAVGLTAAVSTARAQAGIGCNVIAGVHHDHLFVPAGTGPRAMAVLESLQRAGA
jgi:hypothetical protein